MSITNNAAHAAGAWLLAVTIGVAACAGAPPSEQQMEDALAVGLDDPVLRQEAKLRARLAASPFEYLRYVNAGFQRAVCIRYQRRAAEMPTVNLHGDAHLEQYAVADDGRGIADFDDAALGPPVIDWIRFAASLRVVAEERRWSDGDAAVAAFLSAYEEALDDPAVTMPEPSAAARLRSRFRGGVREWLLDVEKLMLPLSADDEVALRRAGSSYVDQMLEQNPMLGRSFFDLKKLGKLHMGVGSAREAKFLARVEGPSLDPDDDLILEIKQVARGVAPCVAADQRNDRILLAQQRLSSSPQRFLGYLQLEGRSFFVHAWRVHYAELAVADLANEHELIEIARDVGYQLGKGHPNDPDPEVSRGLRTRLRVHVRQEALEIKKFSEDLADAAIEDWEHDHRALVRPPDAK